MNKVCLIFLIFCNSSVPLFLAVYIRFQSNFFLFLICYVWLWFLNFPQDFVKCYLLEDLELGVLQKKRTKQVFLLCFSTVLNVLRLLFQRPGNIMSTHSSRFIDPICLSFSERAILHFKVFVVTCIIGWVVLKKIYYENQSLSLNK